MKLPLPTGLAVCAGLFLPACLWANDPLPVPDPRHTSLHVAAEAGQADTLGALLRDLSPSEQRERLAQADREGMTPLSYAARAGNTACVRLLLAAGADPDQASEPARWTALHEAANQGHAAVARCLLEAGAKVDALTQDGRSPLMLALAGSPLAYGPRGDRSSTLAMLLAHGASPQALLDWLMRCERQLAEQQSRLEESDRARSQLLEEVRRMQEKLAAIESAVGPPGYRPLPQGH